MEVMNKREFKRKYWYPISVDIERALRKVRVKIDRSYRRYWTILFASFLMFVIGIAIVPMKYDLDNYREKIQLNASINHTLDEPFSDRFQHWRTEGSPGQEPPKQ